MTIFLVYIKVTNISFYKHLMLCYIHRHIINWLLIPCLVHKPIHFYITYLVLSAYLVYLIYQWVSNACGGLFLKKHQLIASLAFWGLSAVFLCFMPMFQRDELITDLFRTAEFPQNGYANRIGSYSSVFGRGRCVFWPQSLNGCLPIFHRLLVIHKGF